MSDRKPDAIVLLAHLMDQNGTLGAETRARADEAVKWAVQSDCRLVLMGWAYRPDTTLCISDAMAAYVTAQHRFPPSKLMIDRQSRDTVGDAVFSKQMVNGDLRHHCIGVMTSDYHVVRTEKIFNFVYGPGWTVIVNGARVKAPADAFLHEVQSTESFSRTFDGVESGDDQAILSRLATHHPFYNGSIHPDMNSISFPDPGS